jgi:alpha-1,2-mannosyltransferase
VFLIWLLVTKRWRAAIAASAAAAAAYAVGIVVYGVDVFRAWLQALATVMWWWAPMNASLEGFLARAFTPAGANTLTIPPVVPTLAAIGSLTLTRRHHSPDAPPHD